MDLRYALDIQVDLDPLTRYQGKCDFVYADLQGTENVLMLKRAWELNVDSGYRVNERCLSNRHRKVSAYGLPLVHPALSPTPATVHRIHRTAPTRNCANRIISTIFVFLSAVARIGVVRSFAALQLSPYLVVQIRTWPIFRPHFYAREVENGPSESLSSRSILEIKYSNPNPE